MAVLLYVVRVFSNNFLFLREKWHRYRCRTNTLHILSFVCFLMCPCVSVAAPQSLWQMLLQCSPAAPCAQQHWRYLCGTPKRGVMFVTCGPHGFPYWGREKETAPSSFSLCIYFPEGPCSPGRGAGGGARQEGWGQANPISMGQMLGLQQKLNR